MKRGSLDKRTGYLLYTALFALLFTLCFLVWLILLGRSPIRRSDGLEQHFVSFVLVGRWIRGLLGGNFEMWSDSIGLGGDLFTSMFGAFTDPMYWLSALVPERFAEYLFDMMIVLKVYLSGLAFMAFCFYRKNPVWPTIAGAIVYTFSASMYLAFFESVCISWMYVLPVVMAGTIRFWEKNKPGLFVASLTFAFISQFYFAYMSAMIVLGYCVVRAAIELINKSIKIKEALIKALRFALYAALSFGMAAFAVIPVVSMILTSDRMGVSYYMPALYDKEFYHAFLAGFSSYFNMLGRDCYLGFSVAAIVCVMAMYLLGKGRQVLKAGFILLTIGLCVPFIGHVMNGMSYPSNRWVWAYVFLVAYIVTVTIPRLGELSWAKKGIIIALCAVYGFFSWTLNDGYAPSADYTFMRTEYYQLASIGVMVMAIALLLSSHFAKRIYPAIAISLIAISVVIPAYITFHPTKRNLFGDEITATTAMSKVREGGLAASADIVSLTSGERMEQYNVYNVRNGTWITGVNSTDFYMNICNNYVESFMREIGLRKSPWSGGYNNLDSRAEIEALMGVNYVVAIKDDNTNVSAGYSPLGTDIHIMDDDCVIHETVSGEHSIAMFMDKAMSYEDYLALDMQQRQQALTRAVVIEGGDTPISDLGITDDTVPFTVESMEGCTLTEDGFNATAGNATAVLDIETIDGCALYIGIEGLDFTDGKNTDSTVYFTAINTDGDDTLARGLWFINNRNHMYGGITDWLVNMGQVTEDCTKIRLTFSRPGTYSLPVIKIYARAIETVTEDVSSIKVASEPSDITYDHGSNTYSLHVDADRDGYLLLAVPYSDGWSCTANGQETEILRADTGFMAIYLKPGSYDILLKYRTPGLTGGICVSIFSCLAFAGVITLERKKGARK
ncbi:MAG: YfhO family protein [Saccharofermentans sp.]|nr:YfhO family protein [Saccharofermentans sp.]